MKKNVFTALALLLGVVMLLAGCSNGPAEPDEEAVVITVGSREVKESTFYSLYNYYAAQYGVTDEAGNEEMVQYMKEIVLEMIIEENVLLEMADEAMITLNEEEIAAANAEYEMLLEDWRGYFGEELANSAEPPAEEELEAAIEQRIAAYMEENNYTHEYLIETFRNASILDKLYEDMIADVEVSDDELQAYYDEEMTLQKETFALYPSEYENLAEETTPLYHIPARKVRHILVGLTEDQQAEISTLRYGSDEVAADTAAADELLAEYLKEIEAEANAVLARVTEGGEDFGTVMAEVSKDPGGAQGYLVAQGSTTFVQSFTDGAWALEAVGAISGLVPSDFGYHILILDEEIEEHASPFEDVKEELLEAMLETKRTDTYYAKLDAAREKMNIVVEYECLGMNDPNAVDETAGTAEE